MEFIFPPNDFPLEWYQMNPGKHGLCLIINNLIDDPKPMIVAGANACVGVIRDLGDQLRFRKVIERSTHNGDDMLEAVTSAAAECTPDDDCIAVFILSHGEENGVLRPPKPVQTAPNAGDTTIQQLKTPLLTRPDFQHLRGKPKMFFILACRGKINEMEALGGQPAPPTLRIAVEADFLIYQSNAEGYKSYMSATGSQFITFLCDALKKYASSQDVISILTLVNEKVQLCTQEPDEIVHMPCITSTLRKRLYLENKAPVPKNAPLDVPDARSGAAAPNKASGTISKSDVTSTVISDIGDTILMTPEHKRVLRKVQFTFRNNMQNLDAMASYLQTTRVFTSDDVSHVAALGTNRPLKFDKFFELLLLKQDRAFFELVRALEETKQHALAIMIDPNSVETID